MKIKNIKEKIEGRYVSLASVTSKNKPHAIAAEVNKIKNNKVIITNNFMKKTINNIMKNPNVSLVLIEGEKGWRIDGKAKHHNSGRYLEFVKSLETNKKYNPKGAIVIEVEEVKELG